MKKFKKIFAFVLTAAMVVCSMPNYGVETDAATHEDVITGATSSKTTKGFEITEKGVKVTFDAKMTTDYAWDSPQFVVYSAADDSASNITTDRANENFYFLGRSDNYAIDKVGNRWADDEDPENVTTNKPLANGNSFVFDGTFTKAAGVELNSSYTLEAYKVGDSAIIVFSNETFTSTSQVKLDTSKTNYVAIIANYCNITNIEYEAMNNVVTTIPDVTTTGYDTARSEAVTLTDKPVVISALSTTTATNNWNGACVFIFNGNDHCAAVRADSSTNAIANWTSTCNPSYGGDWVEWNDRGTQGIGTVVVAKVVNNTVVVTFGNNTFGSTTIVEGIDPAKGVTLRMTGDVATVSNISVSSEADYYDITSYRSGSEYTAPTKAGKIFAGWFTDSTFETAVADDVTTGYAYAKFVDANLLAPKYQLSAGTTAQSDSTNVRVMLGVDTLDYSDLGFEIEYKTSEYPYNSTTVYSGISVGNTVEEPSTYFGSEANYMLPYVLRGLTNENFDETFTVRAYWVTLDGTKVYGAERTFTAGDNL